MEQARPKAREGRVTRREILDRLKRQVEVTAPDLAEQIGVTPMAIRQHLSSLEADGLVRARSIRQKMGRPRRAYSLTDEACRLFPSGYDDLAISLLDAIAETDGTEKIDSIFEARRKKLREAYAERMAGKTLAEKIEILAKLRDDSGYMCTSEATGEQNTGHLLVEHHCPVHAIAKKYPSICHHEIEMFRELLAEDGVSVERIEHIVAGGHHCRYRITPKGAPV